MNLFGEKQYQEYAVLVNSLLECSDLDQLEVTLLSRLSRLVPSDNSVLLRLADDGVAVESSLALGLDTTLFPAYQQHYQKLDEYKARVHHLSTPPVVNRASDFLEYSAWDRNEHRADFLLRQGIYHMACLELVDNGRIKLSFSLHRVRRHENFSDRDLDVLRVLSPILHRAYRSLSQPLSEAIGATDGQKLTGREAEILPYLLTPLPNDEIARRLAISPNTLKTHIRHTLDKAQCHSRFELLTLYRSAGTHTRRDEAWNKSPR